MECFYKRHILSIYNLYNLCVHVRKFRANVPLTNHGAEQRSVTNTKRILQR